VVALPIWLLFVLLVIVAPAAVVGLQVLVRRRWPHLADGGHNDVAGFIIAIVGVIYAVLLAFVVIVSWEEFSRAESVVGQEASALRGLYRESAAFPPEVRERVEADVRAYTTAVLTEEWPAMSRANPGTRPSPPCSTAPARTSQPCRATAPCARRTSRSRPTGSPRSSRTARSGSTSSSRGSRACCGSRWRSAPR